MYRAIRNINKEIKTTAIKLNINMDNYNLDDIYNILLDNDLLNSLERIFNSHNSINEQSLNICNKFECEVIKVYLQLNKKKINKKRRIELKRFDNNFDINYNDIVNYEFFSEEREKQLLRNYKLDNNQKSLELLVGAYQKMIINMAKKYTSDDYLLLDLIQAGNIGLIKTINNYDINYDVRLHTFAYRNISNYIYRTFYKYKYSDMYGYNVIEFKDKVERYINDYIYKYSCFPSDEVIVKDLNIDYENLKYIKSMRINESLNEDISVECLEEDNYSDERIIQEELLYSVKDEYNLEDVVEENDIEKIIIDICRGCLNEKEFIVMMNILRLNGADKSQEELIKEVATCKQYVSHIKKRAIEKLKNNKKIKKLVKDYLK